MTHLQQTFDSFNIISETFDPLSASEFLTYLLIPIYTQSPCSRLKRNMISKQIVFSIFTFFAAISCEDVIIVTGGTGLGGNILSSTEVTTPVYQNYKGSCQQMYISPPQRCSQIFLADAEAAFSTFYIDRYISNPSDS